MGERYADPCRISAVWDADHVVVTLAGELDLHKASYLGDYLDLILDQGVYRLVIDLHDLDFIDSAAMGAVVGAARHCVAAGGGVALRSVPPLVRLILAVIPFGALLVAEAESLPEA